MSLEDLKKDWDSATDITDQPLISNDQIEQILQAKYRSFINRFLIFEVLMLLVYLYFIGLTVFRFNELKIRYLEVLGGITIVILSFLFLIRISRLMNTYRLKFLHGSPARIFEKIAELKINNQKFFFLNIISGFLIVVILSILNIKIYNEYDLIQEKYFWFTIIPASFVFIFFINYWIKNFYAKTVTEANDLRQILE